MPLVRDLLIRLGLDDRGFKEKIKGAKDDIDGLGSGFSAAVPKIAAVGAAAVAAAAALVTMSKQGEEFRGLNEEFQRLYGKTQQFASDGLGKLSAALEGTVSKIDILKAANLAGSLDLSAEALLTVAKASDQVADSLGKDTKDAFEDLTRAVALGEERLLKQYGIVVNNDKAYTEFAKKLGTTADKLNEAGKHAAITEAALARLKERTDQSGKSTASVADAYEQLTTEVSNAVTEIATAVNRSELLASSLSRIASLIRESANAVASFKTNLSLVADAAFNRTKIAELADVLEDIKEKQAAIASFKPGRGFLGVTSDKLKEDLAALEKQREILVKGIALEKEFDKAHQASTSSVKAGTAAKSEEQKQVERLEKELEELRKKYLKTDDATDAAKKKTEEMTKAIAEMNRQVESSRIGDLFSEAQSGNLVIDLDAVSNKFRDSLVRAQTEAYGRITPEMAAAIDSQVDYQKEQVLNSQAEIAYKAGQEQQEALTKAYENSVATWEDLFMNAIDGTTFNLEDALKRVAVGFAAQIAGSFLQLPGGVNSASGFGQMIASQLGFGGTPGSGGNAPPGGLGASLFTEAGITALMSKIVPLAAVAVTAQAGIDGISRLSNGDKLTDQQRLLLFAPTFGFSELANMFGPSNFGGTTNEETLFRRDFRGMLQETMGQNLDFQGMRGPISLFNSDYSLGNRTAFTDQAIGFANPLAELFAGGDDKKRADIAGIFADAIDDVENYNELIITTQGLLDGLGVNAEEAKDELTNLFLDGKVTLDEYNAGMSNLNLLMQEGLPGIGDVAGAFDILSDSSVSMRTRIHALAISFNEMAEIGITSASDIAAYMTEHFGPEIGEMFRQMATDGIMSFEDINDASSDEMNRLANILDSFLGGIGGDFGMAGEEASKAFIRGTNPILDQIGKMRIAVDGLRRDTAGAGNVNTDTGYNSGAIIPLAKAGRNPNSKLYVYES